MSETAAFLNVLGRNAVVSGPGVITAAHPAAAGAGAAALSAGGNAFDAVLAACFMETIALPMKCGLAGDLVALFRRADGPVETLVSVGAGAAAIADGALLSRTGPGSVGVPGAPHGYTLLHRFARLDLAQLIRPAVRAADAGIAWTDIALGYLREAVPVLAKHSPDHPYAPDGRMPHVGDIRRLPGLGALLVQFAQDRDDLFCGAAGARLAAFVRGQGGHITEADLASKPGRIAPSTRIELAPGGPVLFTTPAPTQGPLLAEVIAQAWHDRSAQALPEIVAGVRAEARRIGRLATDGGTSAVTCADHEGNVAVVLQSNSFPQFASGLVMDDGLVLNNRPGRGFDLSAPAGAPAAPAAGKVPPTTVHAWALEKDGRLFAGGTPGGVNQLPWNAQALSDLLSGTTLAETVTAPHWAVDADGVLSGEAGLAPGLIAGQAALAPLSLRSVLQILCVEDGMPHRAAVDPRAGAAAIPVY